MTDEIARLFAIDSMRNAVGFDNPISRQSLVDTSVAVLAAVCLDLGYERGLEAFELVLGRIDDRQSEIAAMTMGGSAIERLRALNDVIDPAASYTQLLQELTASIDGTTPDYSTRIEGPSHASTAITSARWRDWQSKSRATTKQGSRQAASHNLLIALRTHLGSLEAEALAFAEAKAQARASKGKDDGNTPSS